jgi:hypothetical protein
MLTQVPSGMLQTTAQYYGFKNRIINGGMVIDQRDAGASITPTTSNTYCVDRWSNYISQSSKYSIQQNAGSVTPPVGFSNYLGVTSLSAYSVGASDYFLLIQNIEGYNIADLGWGTANAKTVTLSFQVYSSLTGTFGGALKGASGTVYSYPFTYSISSANTWTTISITIPGPTSGTWTSNNTTGIQLSLGLGAGSSYAGAAGSWQSGSYYSATGAVSVVGTNNATFYITGVQFEVGTQATSFDYRSYGTELALCQRYAVVLTSLNSNDGISGLGTAYSTTHTIEYVSLPVTPRINNPTISYSGTWNLGDGVTASVITNIASGGTSINSASLDFTVASGLTTYRPYYAYSTGIGSKIIISMEL